MRSSKKRKFDGPTRQINVTIPIPVYDKLAKMAGPVSLGSMVETLIEREYGKRVKKMETLPVQDSHC